MLSIANEVDQLIFCCVCFVCDIDVFLQQLKLRNNYFNEFNDHIVGKKRKEREAHRVCRDMKLSWVYYILEC